MAGRASNNALAIKTVESQRSSTKGSVVGPEPSPTQALIRVSHAAQNSMDVVSLDSGEFSDGSVLGYDFVGTVEKVGSHVSLAKKGDIIGGMVYGGQILGFSGDNEYTLTDERLCFKLPPNISREEAVTTPLAACIAYLGLFSKSCLNADIKHNDVTVLIWGASSCVGRFAIQIAAMYRFRIIATCGPSSFDLVKSLGADHVLDYCDEDACSRIHELAPGLQYAFDAVGSQSHSAALSRALTGKTRNLCTIFLSDAYLSGIASGTSVSNVRAWEAFLCKHHYEGKTFQDLEEVDKWNKAGELRGRVGTVNDRSGPTTDSDDTNVADSVRGKRPSLANVMEAAVQSSENFHADNVETLGLAAHHRGASVSATSPKEKDRVARDLRRSISVVSAESADEPGNTE
ncbi:hypothetical protein PHISP_06346 [Aspergillus sp. HF37]|nr:hypothetical protein PHISP_06346 [Aspergillus sp. HF37]